ncbi:hypothetical protein [Vibrio gallaecicus]|uniref:hypothetical protein n=1 Tax=Vibrio gallaecicus TaxID=552386 RepID=UPI0025B4385F|nr:hypothetical protein [Vibrio gallaecicus]MDN3615238.1 hypothetical protein [Vibrio gallaecicus]
MPAFLTRSMCEPEWVANQMHRILCLTFQAVSPIDEILLLAAVLSYSPHLVALYNYKLIANHNNVNKLT